MPDRERRYLAAPLPEVVMATGDRQAEWGVDAAIEAEKEAREIQLRRAKRFRPEPEDVSRVLDVYRWLT
jgi:hypothetical protein